MCGHLLSPGYALWGSRIWRRRLWISLKANLSLPKNGIGKKKKKKKKKKPKKKKKKKKKKKTDDNNDHDDGFLIVFKERAIFVGSR